MVLGLGLALSLAIGLSLGLIGGGGSIITVPVLVYVLGVPPRSAVGMSLAVVGSTALVSALLHDRRGTVAWRTGAIFAGSGVASSYLGSKFTRLVSPQVLLLLFGVLMLVVSAVMLTRGHSHPEAAPHHRPSLWREILTGVGVGFLTGFLGVGGGFLIVPALVVFGGLAMRVAIGTSLFVIAVNSAAGLAGHVTNGDIDWKLTGMVASLALIGALLGSALSHRIHPKGLRRVFAWFVAAVGLFLIIKNYNALIR